MHVEIGEGERIVHMNEEEFRAFCISLKYTSERSIHIPLVNTTTDMLDNVEEAEAYETLMENHDYMEE